MLRICSTIWLSKVFIPYRLLSWVKLESVNLIEVFLPHRMGKAFSATFFHIPSVCSAFLLLQFYIMFQVICASMFLIPPCYFSLIPSIVQLSLKHQEQSFACTQYTIWYTRNIFKFTSCSCLLFSSHIVLFILQYSSSIQRQDEKGK